MGKKLEVTSQVSMLVMAIVTLFITVVACWIAFRTYQKNPVELSVQGIEDGSFINGSAYLDIVTTGTGYNRVVTDLFDSQEQRLQTWLNTRVIEIAPTQLEMPDGDYSLRVQVFRGKELKKQRLLHFTLDRAKPSVKVIGLGSGDVVVGLVQLTVAVDGELAPVQVTVSLDGRILTAFSALDTTLLADGSHNLAINVCDRAGNCSLQQLAFLVDNKPPRIVSLGITSPVRGDVVLSPVYEEANVKSAIWLFDDREMTESARFLWNTTLWSDGIHNVEFRITDVADRTVSQRVTVVVDNTPPTLVTGLSSKAVVSGRPGFRFNATPVYCEGSASIRYVLDGQTQEKAMIDLSGRAAGSTAKLEVIATDPAGNESKDSVELTIGQDTLAVVGQAIHEIRRRALWGLFKVADILAAQKIRLGSDIIVTSGSGLETIMAFGVRWTTLNWASADHPEEYLPIASSVMVHQIMRAPWDPSHVYVNAGAPLCMGISFIPPHDSQSLLPAGAYGGEFSIEHWECWNPDLKTAEPIRSEQRGWVDITYESLDPLQLMIPSVHALIGAGSVTVESHEDEGQQNAQTTAIRAGIGFRFSVSLVAVLAFTAAYYILAAIFLPAP